MGNKTIVGITKKGLILPLRSSYKSACHHPLLLAIVAILALLYRFLPYLFNLLLSISPVLVLSFLLLAILLTFSEPNVPDNRVESPPHDHPRRTPVGGGVAHGHCPARPRPYDDGRRRVELAEGRDVVVSNSNRKAILLNSRHRAGAKRDVVVLGATSPAVQVDEGKPTASDSDSERGESSPNGSVGDIIPIIDELHPLLDDGASLIAPAPDSDASSVVSTSDNDGSEEDETENRENEEEDDEDEDEEEETNEEKDDGTEAVLKWTADDEKNLRDVGTSELERNQRLEHLIAKRRARTYQRSETERNLIDLGSNDPSSVVEELSRLLVMIPPRKNPFDLPYGPEEAAPGSAPSVLAPRRNPFDLPVDEGSGAVPPPDVGFGFQEVAAPPVHARDAFFRRHESFAIGASVPHERRESRFKPYFAADGLRYAHAHSLSDGIADPVVGPAVHVHTPNPQAPAGNGSHQRSASVGNEARLQRSAQVVAVAFQKVVETVSDGGKDYQKKGLEPGRPATGETRAEVVEAKYNGESSPSYSDYDNLARPRGDSPAGSHDSIKSVIAESELMRRTEEANDEKQIAEPVYDSSPSALEKSGAASFEEALLSLQKKGGSSSSSSSSSSTASSDAQVAEASLEEDYANDGGLWVASPSLALVDRNESEVREISEIREDDVIQAVPPLPFADMGSFKEPTKLSSGRAFPARLVLGNDESRPPPVAPQPPPEETLPPPSPPSMFGVVETKVSILPPIPEEIVEDLKHEEEEHDAVAH